MRHVVNPLVRLVARSPLALWTGALTLLTFTTRRTGRRLTIPVLTHRVGQDLLVFTDAGWAANFQAPRPVTLTTRGQRQDTMACLIEDPQQTAAALGSALRQAASPRRLGLALAPGYQPTTAELVGLRHAIRLRRNCASDHRVDPKVP